MQYPALLWVSEIYSESLKLELLEESRHSWAQGKEATLCLLVPWPCQVTGCLSGWAGLSLPS